MTPNRPQMPGYLANMMARLFHDISGAGLLPLGIQPDQFPVLMELWSASDVSRQRLVTALELDAGTVDDLVRSLVSAGLISHFPYAPDPIQLTQRAIAIRDKAVAAARRANETALDALSEAEAEQLTSLMNRVIDALQAVKALSE